MKIIIVLIVLLTATWCFANVLIFEELFNQKAEVAGGEGPSGDGFISSPGNYFISSEGNYFTSN